MKFTHLHVHSHYSLLDGLPKIDELIDRVIELKMDSIALTDHGVMYGAVEFFQKAKAKNVKPIIGCEVYVAFEKMEQKRPNIDDKKYHLILLAKDAEGYKNLVQLVTKAHLEGFYYKPRVDEDLLAKHSKGLIAMSACIAGKIPRLIISGKMEEAEATALKYQNIFGEGNFYLEIQHHPHIKEQQKVNDGLVAIAKKHNIPLVATNDSHYLRPEDAEAQDVLMLINTGASSSDPERLTMKNEDFSLLPGEKMEEYFKDVPEAIENTQKIAEKCNFEFDLGKTKLPVYEVPGGKNPDDYLTELSYEGIKKRFGENPPKEAYERLDYELSVIKKTGFASYFLIVQDFVNWAKQNRIVVGPGRGSAGGSLTAYVTNITNVDPLKNHLLFERFLNPERISMPDIDMDFTDRRRDEVLGYVSQKYGKDRVAQIITFGTMAARAVIRDVGRALGYEYSYCDKVAKMIPTGMDLNETLEKVAEFKTLYDSDIQAKKLIDLGKKLEGVARHASTHACGVVISALPLTDLTPLQHPTQEDETIVTQYEMHGIEALGLLKMDFLGLKNLTIIEDTLARIYVLKNEKVDLDNIPLDDPTTFKIFQKAETTGIFQVESDGMKRYLRDLVPTKFEDIEAMVALYRPGPMELIPTYIRRKHKQEPIEYIHPSLKPILESTYGIILYQEQLMKIAQELSGFTLGEADILRKAVGKKIKTLLDAQEEKFVSGAEKKGVKKEVAQKIWQWILPFASYGFNKCLSGDTKIIDAKTGSLIKLKDLYSNRKLAAETFSISENHTIEKKKISNILYNGKKQIYELKTKSGRTIKATTNHRFSTCEGWQQLKNIKVGDKIATPRVIPQPQNSLDAEDHKVALLGYLLAEGNFCHPSGFYFYSKSKAEIEDYIQYLDKFQNTMGKIDHSKSAAAIYSKRIKRYEKSEAVEWINSLGLRYKKATEKFIPSFAFNLSNQKIALLVAKMFQGDGCINYKNECAQIFYATSSPMIARGLQHLLLRLGIISVIHGKKFKYRNGIKIGYTINISRYNNIQKFIDNFEPYLLTEKKAILQKIKNGHPVLNNLIKNWSARGSKDVVPAQLVKSLMRQSAMSQNLTFIDVAERGGFSERLFTSDPKKIGYLRETVEIISNTLNDQNLKLYAHSDIFWDEVASITKKNKEDTFDLTIEGNHNFIANDIFVHNSHSCAYATIAYQTAYLKAHYPVEFMAALLTSEKADIERIAVLIDECKRMKIEVLAPNVNESLKNFTVVPGQNKIRFGLLAVKNVGENIIDAIVEERKKNGQFTSITNFFERVCSKDLNKKSFESLVKAGAFDTLEERNQLLHNMERLLEWSRENQKNKKSGQKGLFGEATFVSNIKLEKTNVAGNFEKLKWEKELLGLYVTSHPLEDYKEFLKNTATPISKLKSMMMGQRVKVGGIISTIKKIITKKGQPMLFIKLEDLTDKAEVVVFPSVLERDPDIFLENKIVFVSGKVDHRDNQPKIIADEFEEIVTS